MPRFEVSVSGAFEAGHWIDGDGANDAYRRIHGHSFVVTVATASDAPRGPGWVMDLGVFEAALKSILAELDHRMLNDVPGLESPTLENLLVWLDTRLKEKDIVASRIEIERPTVRQKAVFTP